MKIHRMVNLCMIILFCIILAIPTIYVNKTSGNISYSENRMLANFPDVFDKEGRVNTNLKSEFETWFNDNLGFRDKMVQGNTFAQYYVFSKLNKSNDLLGKNNWIYYINDDIIKDYQNLNLLSDDELSMWSASLERINQYLKSENTPLLTMINLDKKTIYPEFYPDTILKTNSMSRTEQFLNYMNENSNINIFTPKNELLQAKQSHVVYSQNYDDGHWNKYGSLIGYKKLIGQLKHHYPNLYSLDYDDYIINPIQRELKVNNAVKFIEQDYELIRTEQSNYHDVTYELSSLPLEFSEVTFRSIKEQKNLPKALMVGDSYTYMFLFPELAESFSEFTFVPMQNVDKLQALIDLLEPDLVIVESVERMLEYLMSNLQFSQEKFISYTQYEYLPTIDNSYMYIDYINGQIVPEQSNAQINTTNKYVTITGWALEKEGQDVLDTIYIKAGDKYYSGIYGSYHSGVSSNFGNEDLGYSGYTFFVDAQKIIEAGGFQIIGISSDKSKQYVYPFTTVTETK